jgi:glutamate synthase (NADPH/NADH) small chain
MKKTDGFLQFNRKLPARRNIAHRLQDYREIYYEAADSLIQQQSARCMDCGVPFCHSACPLGNLIPEFNEAVFEKDWKTAYEALNATNPLPEFTGRICPAPCEAACVLGINQQPVTIEFLENTIIEKAFDNGWIQAFQYKGIRKGNVAIVGSGPAGLAAAILLNQAGYKVTIYEKSDKPGGLLRYGIPDFKLEKSVVERRIDWMKASGIIFKTGMEIGKNISITELREEFDSILLCLGAEVPRDLNIPGRNSKGVYYAMEFLESTNRMVAGEGLKTKYHAGGKHVVVIGGGDTGADCVGTANRHGAASITQIELLAQPPTERDASTPWPLWPMKLRTSSSHEEGCERKWALSTKSFISDHSNKLKAIEVEELEWVFDEASQKSIMKAIPDSNKLIPCDLALIACGFTGSIQEKIIEPLEINTDKYGRINTHNYQTSAEGIFSAGDMRTGQSIVVKAIAEGMNAAKAIIQFLVEKRVVNSQL